MKTLLLLGGMTPDVTSLYYKTINTVARARLGARHSAPLYLFSAEFESMVQSASRGDWTTFAQAYLDPVDALVISPPKPKVQGVVVGAILAHKVAKTLEDALKPTGVPFLHVADFLARHVKRELPHVKTLGLVGPKITMLGAEDPDFFIGRLQGSENGLRILVPDSEASLDEVNRGMMEEVAKGAASVTQKTKEMFVREARALVERGAQAIILGSTDLGFVVSQEDVGGEVPLLDAATIHAEGVANWAIDED
ncbi:asp/Glu/Hydantoin racemase domain-containing protein [Sarocladium implicatum]|nr:asp/Glu/Hydantoin racemase domain-containing protein [Sarocladium implicatum]